MGIDKTLQHKTQRLMRRVKENRENRARDLARTKWYQERVKQIEEAPKRTRTDFWCAECRQDFTCIDALKMVSSARGIPLAYYEAACPRGHIAIRHITDKHQDPYYFLSEMLKRQRYEMRDDLLTPADPRFRIKYPKQWAQLEEEREVREMMEEEENRQLYG